jgi:membrane associated rhomboid family serine protease
MIPLSDASRRPVEFPAVTVWLIALNLVAFGLELLGGDEFVLAWSVTPAVISAGRFLTFDLLGGLVAFAAQIAVDPASTIPTLGASGASAAVMGAFLVWYPHDRIKTLVPIGPLLTLMSIPAALLIGLWLLIQMLNEVGALVDMQSGGVAYVTHIAGALFGTATAGLFPKPRVLEDGGPSWEPTTRFGRHL